MSLRIVVVGGPAIGSQLRLTSQDVVEIGSAPSNHLTLPDPQVAELHLKLYREGRALVCFDVTGRGFGHNQQRVLKATLQVGDLIQLGAHTLRLIADRPDQVPRVDPQLISAGRPNGGGAILKALRGNDAGKTFPIGDKAVVIMGRGAETDITIWDIRASRAHARIDRQGSVYRLSDLNSSNGTYVNGTKIRTHHLQPGDEIKIGASVLQFAMSG